MKNILKKAGLFVALGLTSLTAFAQNSYNVPQSVESAFSAKYPQARLKKWRSAKDCYTAFFTNDGKKYTAKYSISGAWINTSRDIRHKSSLPENLQSFLRSGTYASWHIDAMRRVRTPQANIYEVVLDNHSGSPIDYEDAGSAINRELCFDDGGRLIKEVNL